MGPLQGGACEGVEDPTATTALEVDDRGARATVDAEV